MRWALNEMITNFTVIKDGVDLKKRFKRVLDRHPNTNMESDAAKDLIALELYEQVIRDSAVKKEEWREKIRFKNAEKGSKGTSG